MIAQIFFSKALRIQFNDLKFNWFVDISARFLSKSKRLKLTYLIILNISSHFITILIINRTISNPIQFIFPSVRFLRNLNFTENTRTKRSYNVLKIKSITIHFRNGSRGASDIWKCGCCPVETVVIFRVESPAPMDDITRFCGHL